MQVGGWVKTLPLLLYIAISNDVIKTYNDQLHLANLDLVGIPNFFFSSHKIYMNMITCMDSCTLVFQTRDEGRDHNSD